MNKDWWFATERRAKYQKRLDEMKAAKPKKEKKKKRGWFIVWW